MHKILVLDYETRSTVDLTVTGAEPYARDPSTDVWCAAYAFDDLPVELWLPGQQCPAEITEHVEAGRTVVCHNFSFEYNITRHIMAPRYGWPVIQPTQVHDTCAEAFALAIPGKLENAAAALGLDAQKDMKGHRLMLQMCQPRSIGADERPIWWDDQERRERLYAYAKMDVEAERELYSRSRRLSRDEHNTFVLDHKINERGVYIDQPLVRASLALIDAERARMNKRMSDITGGVVGTYTQTAALTAWVVSMGVPAVSIAKDQIKLMSKDETVPAIVNEALAIRAEANKSSTAKLTAMLGGISSDGRVKHLHQYHAATTGRWGGRKIQTQNLPRGTLKSEADIEAAVAAIMRGDSGYMDNFCGGVMSGISSCIRAMITAAPGNKLITSDFSNIEGRVLAWLAGEEWKLKAFSDFDKGIGADLYRLAYAKSFNIPVEDVTGDQRQVGKCQELALGFGGGVGAFQSMAKIYGVSVDEKAANGIKNAWRSAHPETVEFWSAIESAALFALSNTGSLGHCGTGKRAITYRKSGSFLLCKLPSGREIVYPYAQLVEVETPWGELRDGLSYKTQGINKKWITHQTWYGELVENVVQAVARDCLADAMHRVEAAGYPIVMHVHDEIVSEVRDNGKRTLAEFERVMGEVPVWAEGMPIAVSGWEGKRYRKD